MVRAAIEAARRTICDIARQCSGCGMCEQAIAGFVATELRVIDRPEYIPAARAWIHEAIAEGASPGASPHRQTVKTAVPSA